MLLAKEAIDRSVPRRQERRADIDRAKGLAILLVVFGHLVARKDPLNVGWYEPLRLAVYAFHMPFFLYLSGTVTVFSGALFTRPEKWRALSAARARRLLIPFFALGIGIACGKSIFAHFVFIDNKPQSLQIGLADLIWHTRDSPASSIWYLYAVFILGLAAPILVWANNGRLYGLLLAGLALYCLPMPQYAYLFQIGRYGVFFAAGAFAATHDRQWTAFVDRHWRPLLLLFVCALAMLAEFGKYWPEKSYLLPAGLLSLPALHGLVRHVPARPAAILFWLGGNSMVIYLFNTIFIGLAKAVLLHFTSWNGAHFLYFAALAMLCGVLGPIMLRQLLFRRIAIVELYTR